MDPLVAGAFGMGGLRGGEHVREGDNPQLSFARWTDTVPPFGRMFDKAAQVTLAVGGPSDIIAFALPVGFIGLLRFFANQVGASDAPYVKFTLLVNGAAVVGYSNIIGQKSPSLTSPDALVAPIHGGGRVVVVATNTGSSSIQNVAGRIKGWFWSPAQEAAWLALTQGRGRS